MGIIINSALNKRTENINQTRAHLWELADFIADNQQDIVFSTQQMGNSLAKIPEVLNHKAPLLQQILADRLKINPYCSGIIVADRSGNVTSSVPRQDNLRSIANRRSFRNTETSRLFSSGEYTTENVSTNTFFSYYYPLTSEDGSFNGVIVFEIDRNIFHNIQKDSIFPSKPNFMITDHQGVILYSHLFPQFVGKRDRNENFVKMQQGHDAGDSFTGTGNDGIVRSFCIRKSRLKHEKTPYMFIRVSRPYEGILEKANRELLLNFLALGTFSMTAFFLVWLIGQRSIADRIRTMESAALRLAEGDLGVRVSPVVVGGELGRLANAFDQMANQLEDRDEQHETLLARLRFKESKFESLYLLSQMANEQEQVIKDFCMEEGVRTTGSTIGYIFFMNEDETVLTLHSWSKGAMDACQIIEKKTVYNVSETGLWGEAVRQRSPIITNDYFAADQMKKGFPVGHVPIQRHMNIPLIIDDKIVLIAGVGNKGTDYTVNDAQMLTLIMDGMWKLLDKKRFLEEQLENERFLALTNLKLHALNQKFEDAIEQERRHIARELHDQMGQALTGLNLDLNWFAARLDQETVQKQEKHIKGMNLAVESMIEMVKNITARLSPPLLENLGLASAIGHYTHDFERKSGITCHLMLDEGADSCFDKDESLAIFRILQESLTNVARHAHADEVALSLCLTSHAVVFEVADNGKGITDEEINSPDAFGMLGMQERATKCGGSLLISGNPRGGTIVRLEIPQRNGGDK